MDINELQKLIKGSTAVLVLDNGQPSFVIVGYDAYKNLIADKNSEEKEIKIHPAKHGLPVNYSSNHIGVNNISNGVNQSHNGMSDLSHNLQEKESEILERLNKEILVLKQQIEAEEKELINQHYSDSID
ncbi:MAG: hypothetical protein A2817_00915 [Candidatus Yanofskybacteria bacterium RIFCSPHIGHO2_01_FULL_39_8b]|uniref:Uncharacterized protein n=1 Tax=Candidatus Yanofskybacteria bacterium RIFCSPHIGHO2_01_FULL_39_8b TaxID=1802659 RepID=A0A1F8EFY7_9BACT|nr:MAG: hypothetical protein A2817_00915 [Candidatus Yanofskybacteria bacterium RIFCSPHIGHO2_01_FULL_39_8b]